jgi:para-nitrobenzyl esterase
MKNKINGYGSPVSLKSTLVTGFISWIIAAILIIGGASASLGQQYTQGLTQNTQYGQIKGIKDQQTGGLVWRGIKFAKAPAGELRWKAPLEPESWTGVKESVNHGPVCAQRNAQGNVEGEEDCLTLDIYRPDSAQSGLPVYVWIHGGANETGKAAGNNLSYFAKETNVVAAVIQYRLGPLGFFKHDALKTGDPLGDSGNFGLLDQIMAMKWVKNNIGHFGGNPKNVTIAGESAGAHDILALMAAKQAAGLFQKAIYQSGGMNYRESTLAKEVAEGYVQNLKLSAQGGELAKTLRAIKAEAILKAKPKNAAYDVTIDGHLLPASPFCLLKSGNYNKVPILMGGNRNEYSLWLLLTGGPDGKWKNLWRILPNNRQTPLSEILTPEEVETFMRTNSMTGRLWQAKQVHWVARALRNHQKEVFVYDFRWGGTRGSDVEKVFGAAHANEIAFFNFNASFDIWGQNASITKENQKAREALAQAMMTYTGQFLHTGNPNGEAKLPKWEKWSNEKGKVKAIHFDASSKPDDPIFIINMENKEYVLSDLYREIDQMTDPVAQSLSRARALDWRNTEPVCNDASK